MKEVTVFTNGDSTKLSTWSNVPYFFTKTLQAKGIRVNRVDLSPSPLMNRVYRKTYWQVLRLFNRRTSYAYSRSYLHFLLGRQKIRNAVSAFPNAEANIFLTFSFSATGLSPVPSIQFCDWTYDHYLQYFEGRKPDLLERECVRREDSQIEGAELVFPLFPSVAEYMKSRYRNKNIYYLGNVINSLYEVSVPESQISQDKRIARSLIFVGNKRYLEGAKCLIKAYEHLQTSYPTLSVHIIGMNNTDFEHKPDAVHCYGYLDKDNSTDRAQYYSLLQQATVFVNTTPKWGAFSATIEAMYFYTPVIVSPYNEFVETFGREISFGSYCENEPAALAEKISELLDDDAYPARCHNAHTSVSQFTWSTYVDKMLEKIGEKPLASVETGT